MGESPGRKQISINPLRVEYESIRKAADFHGMKIGTLCSALWEWVAPLFRQYDYSVAKMKEAFPGGVNTIGNNLGKVDSNETPLSKIDLWVLGFFHHLEKEGELEDLLQLADTKRYKRPDVSLTKTHSATTTNSQRGVARRSSRAASN